MHTLSRLRCVSLFLIVVLVTLLGEVGCSDKTTDASPPPSPPSNDDQVLITHHKIYFTDSDFIGSPVEQYAYGDSIYIKVLEGKNLRPTLSPVWLYSYWWSDKEVVLMDHDRAPPHGILEDYLVVIAVIPDTISGTSPFDGTLRISAGGDSITAYYFSQTHGQLIFTGVKIGGF